MDKTLKTENQEKVWDTISEKWNDYKTKTSPSVEKFLKDKEEKLLDLGCGSGRNFIKTKNKLKWYCIDFSKDMLKYAEENAKKKKIDIETIKSESDNIGQIKDNFFDATICIAVLHCIPSKTKRQKTIKEIYRTLKPGKTALISVWSHNSPRLRNKPKECFVPWTSAGIKKRYTYIYDKDELENEIKKAGLKIIKSWEERNINIIAKK